MVDLQSTGDGTFALSDDGGTSEGNIALVKPLDYNFGQTEYILNITVTVNTCSSTILMAMVYLIWEQLYNRLQ